MTPNFIAAPTLWSQPSESDKPQNAVSNSLQEKLYNTRSNLTDVGELHERVVTAWEEQLGQRVIDIATGLALMSLPDGRFEQLL